MPLISCRFCGAVGAHEADAQEARARALLAGFALIPLPDRARPVLKEEFALCRYCASHARAHFLAECGATAADVLEAEDAAFENDTNW